MPTTPQEGFGDLVLRLKQELKQSAGSPSGLVSEIITRILARELTLAANRLEIAYQAGFLGSAEERALDGVVDSLGMERRKNLLEGSVTFVRRFPIGSETKIPLHTRLVATVGGKPAFFQTIQSVSIFPGETRASALVRAIDSASDAAVGVPGQIRLVQNVAGVESVEAEGALFPFPESDEELRFRARRRSLENWGNQDALLKAVRNAFDFLPGEIDISQGPAGVVYVCLGDTEFLALSDTATQKVLAEIQSQVDKVRPLGLQVHLERATPYPLEVKATVVFVPDLNTVQQDEVLFQLRQSLRDTVRLLGLGRPLLEDKLVGLLSRPDQVIGVRLRNNDELKSVNESLGPAGRIVLSEPIILTPEGARTQRIDFFLSRPPKKKDRSTITARVSELLEQSMELRVSHFEKLDVVRAFGIDEQGQVVPLDHFSVVVNAENVVIGFIREERRA